MTDDSALESSGSGTERSLHMSAPSSTSPVRQIVRLSSEIRSQSGDSLSSNQPFEDEVLSARQQSCVLFVALPEEDEEIKINQTDFAIDQCLIQEEKADVNDQTEELIAFICEQIFTWANMCDAAKVTSDFMSSKYPSLFHRTS